MKLIRKSFSAGVAFAALAVAACSSQPGSTGGASGSNGGGSTGVVGNSNDVGTVHMNLDVAPGVTVTSFTWTIGNGGTPFTGVDSIGDAQSAEFVAGGIPAGTGYTVGITGTDSAGDSCTGTSGTFSVSPGVVTQVGLAVTCHGANDGATAADVTTGAVEVDAGFVFAPGSAVACPGISSFSISPAEINTAGTATAAIVTVGGAAAINWTVSPATGGTFGSPTAATTSFQCANVPAGGSQVTVTATVALPTSAACAGEPFTTMSALVNCEPGTSTTPPDSGADTGTGTGTPDASPDTGTTATNGTACTQFVGGVLADSTGNTHCIQCPASPTGDGLCTAMEAQLVGFDIAKGNITAANQLKAFVSASNQGSCYSCLNTKSCLDDNSGDSVQECGDAPDLSGNAAGSGVTQCLATLSCILSTDCQGAGGLSGSDTVSQENPALCYCGGDNPGSLCTTAGAAVDGKCVDTEVAGFGFAKSDNADILNDYGSNSLPSGLANQIFICGFAQGCSICR
jgi:hypothetical protein